jgi:phospholipid/cholesterol/gamma-HCH transport system substrate-binding protein
LRVGEVRQVSLSAADPKEVRALVAVDPATPVRADTMIVIDTQGLMGSAVVSMVGGSVDADIRRDAGAGPPTLAASAQAGQTLSQAAKATLKKVDDLLADNSDALHSAINNISTFSAALGRNADKVDDILAGLAKLSGGGAAKPQRTFDLATPQVAPGKPSDAQLAIPDLSGLIVFETQRLLASPHPGEFAQIEGGQWSDTLPKIVQEKMLQSLEAAGFRNVAKGFEGFAAQYQLILDIRAFEISLEPQMEAKVELNAKLGKGGAIVATRSFTGAAPAKSAEAPDAAAALSVAFGKVASDLASWLRGKL